MSYSEMLVWLTQQDVNQMNDGLKLIKVKRIVTDCDKDEEKKTLDKGRDQGKITDPNGLELFPKLLCYNCLNYGHGARDCKAPFCNQCDVVRPDHKSNDCPNPKKKLGRRRSKITPMPKKTKDAVKPVMKSKRKRGLKAITTSSYQTDEDEEDSLRQEAESEWDNDDSVEELEGEEDISDRKRSRRIRTIKYNNERSYIRKTSRRSGVDILALHDSGAQAHATRSTKMLSETIQIYDRKHPGCTQLKGASGEDLNATAIGTIAGLEAPVIVADIEDDIIVSTTQLSTSNHWTVHPPIGVYPGVGVIVIKHNEIGNYGKLMTIGNEDNYSDPKTWNMSDIDILLPDMSPVMQLMKHQIAPPSSPKWMTIKRIQGMERLTSREQVLFSQRTWFAPKNLMKWYVKNIPSFPLTLSQIELHYDSQEVGFLRGHFTMRSHHQANISEIADELTEHKVY